MNYRDFCDSYDHIARREIWEHLGWSFRGSYHYRGARKLSPERIQALVKNYPHIFTLQELMDEFYPYEKTS